MYVQQPYEHDHHDPLFTMNTCINFDKFYSRNSLAKVNKNVRSVRMSPSVTTYFTTISCIIDYVINYMMKIKIDIRSSSVAQYNSIHHWHPKCWQYEYFSSCDMWYVLDTRLSSVFQWLATGRRFPPPIKLTATI